MKIRPDQIEKFEKEDSQPIEKLKKKKNDDPIVKDKKRLKESHRIEKRD